MRQTTALTLAVTAMVTACGKAQSPENATHQTGPCARLEFDGSSFTDCLAVQDRHRIHLVLDGADGQPLRRLAALPAQSAGGAMLAFAMNGGMFDEDGKPIGLFVGDEGLRRTLNRKSGPGNFHMLPNGVFFGDGRGWQVEPAEVFARRAIGTVRFATQSGPMLVIGGKLHPSFSADGESRYIRNGVGIDGQGRAHFVISEEPVSFGKLARLYRDRLHCANALYFDGFVSSLRDPARDRTDEGALLGPLVVVESVQARVRSAGLPAD